MIRTIMALAVGAVALAAASPATAGYDRKAAVDASKRTFTWTDGAQTSVSGFGWYLADDPANSCDAFWFGTAEETIEPTTVPGGTVGGQTVGPVPVGDQEIPATTLPSHEAEPVTIPGGSLPATRTPAAPFVDYCDTTLVRLAQGKLTIELTDAGDGQTSDWELYVYRSNRHGDWGALAGESIETGAPEKVEFPITQGYYLVNAVPLFSFNAPFSGKLTFTPIQD